MIALTHFVPDDHSSASLEDRFPSCRAFFHSLVRPAVPPPLSRSKANSYARYLEAGIRQRDKAIADSYLRLESLKEEVDNMRRMLEDGAKESPYIVDRRAIGSERHRTTRAPRWFFVVATASIEGLIKQCC